MLFSIAFNANSTSALFNFFPSTAIATALLSGLKRRWLKKSTFGNSLILQL
jgi:hypothetical protein